jgi:hypothetical protein
MFFRGPAHTSVFRGHIGTIDHKVVVTKAGRLALSNNLLTTLPQRIVECKRLRYLNLRYNALREVPDAVRPPPFPAPSG